jgi:predicted amidohydrolase
MVKLGIVQMLVTPDKSANIESAASHVRACAEQGADIVILPEIFNCPYETSRFRAYAEPAGGATWSALSHMASSNSVILIGGSFPELSGDSVYNASFVFGRDGRQVARHRKVHLFDLDVAGGQFFKESDAITAGNEVTVFDTEFGPIGLCICFDMRFPELARLMVLDGAAMIVVPAAFNMTTGPAHWDLLFRQRAVDNQCFTVGAAAARDCRAEYVSWGNSIVVGPWGSVVWHADEKEVVQVVDIDLAEVEAVRKQLPLLVARRTDVYTIGLANK